MNPIHRAYSIVLLLMTFSVFSTGQGPATGTPPFGSLDGGQFDTVNLGNLNVHFAAPLIHKAGRGMPFSYDLSYDSSIWYPVAVSGSQTWQPVLNWGWRGQTEAATGYIPAPSVSQLSCTYYDPPYRIKEYYYVYVYSGYSDSFGVQHYVPGLKVYDPAPDCGPQGPMDITKTASDGSGWTVTISTGASGGTVTSRSGQTSIVPVGTTSGSATTTDANGNKITVNNSGQFFDTLSSTSPVLTIAGLGTPASPLTFTYTGPTGSQAYTVNYAPYNIQTNFACNGITEYAANNVPLVTSVSLPDGSGYSFQYEDTPSRSGYKTGRVSQVTLPAGGTISYSYTGGNDGINCADGSTLGLSRSVSPGGNWQYTRSGSGSNWTTTVTDPTPSSNQTSINFEEYNSNFYETQRLVYQGSTSGTLLSTTINCYNGQNVGSPSSCYNTAITAQVTRVTNFRFLPNSAGLQSETDSTYDQFGLINEVDEYDYGQGTVGSLLQKTTTIYLGGLSNGIVDRPFEVEMTDANNNIMASSVYSYDLTTPTPTSGTPQHVSITGSRGLLSRVAVNVGGSFRYRTYTYYDTGTLSTSTDLSTTQDGGAPTTYNYSSTNNASCGNSFVTSITEPLGLSRSMTWDCNGGVMLSLTDENNNISSTAYSGANYTNHFWRPYSTTDQAGNTTNYFYYLNSSSQPFQTESKSATFNSGNSIVDLLTTTDGFGRAIFSQTRQGPNSTSYDTVATCYDSLGRVSFRSLPYSAAAITPGSSACPTGNAGTSTAYDALNRTTSVTDSGGGLTSYTYFENDVLQTLSSPTQSKQLEYDALGRLKSVCEVTAGTTAFPGGTCAQNTNPQPIGYWTTYSYDALGNQTGVTQNAQASPSGQQQRTFIYDMLGRLTSETNPEMKNAAITYTYDQASYCATYVSAGNLVEHKDAAGNLTCYTGYDALHRVGSITYPGSSTPTKKFVYDAATVNGTNMANAKTRLAEAYTCSGTCTSKITDLFFSYWPTGQTTDVWELTPHSGTNYYYHVTSQPYPNGVVNILKNLSGLPTITYSTEGEGRLGTASASSGQNPVTSATYNPASRVTALTYGSGDSDSFTFYPNTGRMHTYTFSLNSTPDSGTLNWNPNGTLQQLAINDQIPGTTDTQICTYSHDDLGRVASSNCGCSKWSQTFTYDPFGNITKTVPQSCTGTSFQVSYDYTNNTNRITTSPFSYTSSADPNAKTGNLTADNNHAYTWDTDGHVTGIDLGSSNGICLTYDALGRVVEQDKGSSCTTSSMEIVYSPSGAKLALMNGSSLVKAFVPLPGGAQAVYNSSGLQYYRHPDWLSSSRLATNSSRQLYFSGAYAPFGENYAQSGTQDLSFTGQNQDTEPSAPGGAGGLYDFLYREHSPVQGRWLSPDPVGLAAANPADPQTWNRYAYVGNRPLNTTDPQGLDDWCNPDDPSCDPCFWDPILCWPPPPPPEPGPPPGGGGGIWNPTPPRGPGGVWPGNETLGLPSGLNTYPLDLSSLLSLVPGFLCGSAPGGGFVSTAPNNSPTICIPSPLVVVAAVGAASHWWLPFGLGRVLLRNLSGAAGHDCWETVPSGQKTLCDFDVVASCTNQPAWTTNIVMDEPPGSAAWWSDYECFIVGNHLGKCFPFRWSAIKTADPGPQYCPNP